MLFDSPLDETPHRIEFCAEDPAEAFPIAKRECGINPVEVWEGGNHLGKLTLMQGAFWEIG
ncbi:MAG: hypothetical protein J0I69_06025 [Altererythrobacter sp.]|nr:hypothetical protein [Altererythrobacter sp.]